MGLYQDVRPASLDEVLGNDATIEVLRAFESDPNRPHVFLLAGPAGTGKTTIARILARMFGVSDMDLREVNSANNRGIDTARQVIEAIEFMPSDGESMAYIIDEAHMTTKEYQNAMLKPLEDTPSHVYFFLCTTDVSKIIPAIKTRATLISMQPLDEDQMTQLLRKTNKAKALGVSPQVLVAICDAADGSPRKALVLLEAAAKAKDVEAQMNVVRKAAMSGDEDSPATIELCRALLSGGAWKEIGPMIKAMTDDPESVRYAVMGYASAVLGSGQRNTKAARIIEAFREPYFNCGKAGLMLSAFKVAGGSSD